MNNPGRIRTGWMCILLGGLLATGPLSAQEFNAGIFGGINASQVDRDGYGGYNNLSLTGGVFVNREFSDGFFWQFEIKYGGRGAYYLGENVVEDFHKTSFHYIEFPLSVNYLHQDKVEAEIGVSPDILISYKAYLADRYEADIDGIGDNRRAGINAFAGIYYWFHPSLGAGIRFTYSIIPFATREGASVRYLDSGYFHNVLSLTCTYRILHR